MQLTISAKELKEKLQAYVDEVQPHLERLERAEALCKWLTQIKNEAIKIENMASLGCLISKADYFGSACFKRRRDEVNACLRLIELCNLSVDDKLFIDDGELDFIPELDGKSIQHDLNWLEEKTFRGLKKEIEENLKVAFEKVDDKVTRLKWIERFIGESKKRKWFWQS